MDKNTKIVFPELLPKIKRSEWIFIKAATKAWTLREASRLSGLSISTVHNILKDFYKKGQLKFLIDYRKINLLPLVAIFPKLNLDRAPPFTSTIRKVYYIRSYTFVSALVPPLFIKKYLNCFNAEPLLVIRGYEYMRWSPLSPLAEYNTEKESVIPVFDFKPVVKQYDYPVEVWSNGYRAPDIYDLILLIGRIRNPFARPLAIYREIKRIDSTIPNTSEQVLSYHFNKHVKAVWKGNTALIFIDTRLVPIKTYYFEGKDAPLFARILCQLPGAFSAIIDIDKAVVIAQYPCNYEAYIMQEAETFNIEMPHGYFIQSDMNMVKKVPELWKYVENKKWVFREELAIPVRNTAKLKFNNSA